MAFPDSRGERPRLAPGLLVEPQPSTNSFTFRDPRSGQSHTLRKLDAQLAQWCDGHRTVEEIAALAASSGSEATVEMVMDLVRRMTALGILEKPMLPFDADDEEVDPATMIGFAVPPSFAPPPAAPRPLSTTGSQPKPKPASPPTPAPGKAGPRVTGSQAKLNPAPAVASAPPANATPATGSVRKPASGTAPRVSLPAMPAVTEHPAGPRTDGPPPPTRKLTHETPIATPDAPGVAARRHTGETPIAPAPRTFTAETPIAVPGGAPAGLQDAFAGEGEREDTDMLQLDAAPLSGGPLMTPADKVAQQLEAIASLAMDKAHTPPPAASGGGSRLPWLLVGALVLGGGGYFAYTKLNPEKPVVVSNLPAVRIEVVRATARTGQTLMAAGYLSAPKVITMGATLGGRIQKLYVENGSKVKKNQVLIQFDDGPIRAEMGLAGAKLATASRALKRAKQLFEAEAVTATEVDSAMGAVQIANAEYQVKKEQLEQCKIRAPIAGTVIDVPVHEGEVIKGDSSSGALIKLADLTEMLAEADVNEADVPLIRMGQPADVTSDALSGKTISGKVKEVSQQVDRAKGTVIVKVNLVQPPDVLRPGMSVKVAFREEDDAPKRLLLPRSAVVGGKVFVVEEGKALERPVTYSSVGPTNVEISSGLKEGERVIVEGSANLREGAKVE